MTVPASLSKWAHPPRSNTPRSSSSGPPGPCITPSTETCVVVVSFMVRPFSRVQVSGVTTPTWHSPIIQIEHHLEISIPTMFVLFLHKTLFTVLGQLLLAHPVEQGLQLVVA